MHYMVTLMFGAEKKITLHNQEDTILLQLFSWYVFIQTSLFLPEYTHPKYKEVNTI